MFRKTILDFEDKVGFKNDINVQKLLCRFYKRNINYSSEVEKGGHQPIIPTNYYYRDDLNNNELELYKLICRHFFSSLSAPLEYKTKEYKMKVGNYSFIGKSSEIIDQGFLKFEPSKINEYIIFIFSLFQNFLL
jgi:DNA topoisomerase IA